MKKGHFFLVAIFSISQIAAGQPQIQERKSERLTVGDVVPNILFKDVLNYHKSTIELSELKGKLVILDFWSTYCSSCIESWPKLIELQKKYLGKIQIILVNTSQDKSIVSNVFERRRKIANVNVDLIAACGDSTLKRKFPHTSVPYVAWIDQTGKLISLTFGTSVNEENISSILSGKEIKMRQYLANEDYIAPDERLPLFINGNGGKIDSVSAQSLFAKWFDGFGYSVSLVSSPKLGNYVHCSGVSVRDLYRISYSKERLNYGGRLRRIPNSRVFFKLNDPSMYADTVYNQKNNDRLYIYHLTSPKSGVEEVQNRMQSDLSWYFGLSASWEKRTVKCYVLRVSDSTRISNSNVKYSSVGITSESVNLNGIYVSDFVESLENLDAYYYSTIPIIDKTGFKGRIWGVNFEVDVTNPTLLDRKLREYGMSFTLEAIEVDILVVRDGANQSQF